MKTQATFSWLPATYTYLSLYLGTNFCRQEKSLKLEDRPYDSNRRRYSGLEQNVNDRRSGLLQCHQIQFDYLQQRRSQLQFTHRSLYQ